MNTVFITIFTPTYNRAYIIENLFSSLQKQTFKNFEWLIVDDGSTDNTEFIVKNMIKNAPSMNIRYIKKENGGQHRALNVAIKEAKGKLMMKVDDDDFLSEDALEIISYYESTISELSGYAGVSGLRSYHSGEIIGDLWKSSNDYIDATNLQRIKFGLKGDKAEAYYVDVLRKYGPMPEFIGENKVEDTVLWDRIAANGLKIRWFNRKIYFTEYLPDGMSRNKRQVQLKNFKGYSLYVAEQFSYRDLPLFFRWKILLRYCEALRKKKLKVRDIKHLFTCSSILLYIASFVSNFTQFIVVKKAWHYNEEK